MLLANDQNQVMYVIKVNGVVVSAKFTDRMMAEAQKMQLPAESQAVAHIVPITEGGQQVLMG